MTGKARAADPPRKAPRAAWWPLVRDLFLTPLWGMKRALAVLGASLALIAVAQGLFILIVGPFVQSLFGGGAAGGDWLAGMPAAWRKLIPDLSPAWRDAAWFLPAAIVVSGLCKALGSYFYNTSQFLITLRLANHYRNRLFAAIIRSPWRRIAGKSPAEWVSYIMNDVMFLQARLQDVLVFFRDGVTVVASIVSLVFVHWPSALFLMALSPFLAFGFGRAAKRISWYAAFWQKELAKMAGAVLDVRERFAFVRAQGGAPAEARRFRRFVDAYYRMMRQSIMIRSAVSPAMELVGFGVLGLLYYLTGKRLWDSGFSETEMFQVFVAVAAIFKPLKTLGEQLATYGEARGVLASSLETLRLHAEESVGQSPRREGAAPTALTAPLTIRHLAVGYDDGPVLTGDDLVIAPGEVVAVIGGSGSGKSTLVKALTGLMPPLAWDADVPWADVAAMSNLVSQSPFLFQDPILANLLYGHHDPDVIRVEDVLETLGHMDMRDAVEGLPRGLSEDFTQIHQNLSGGQVQRLVIARALLRPLPILVLDEATSALDARFEGRFTRWLQDFARRERKAVIFVTHRLAHIDTFSQVWFCRDGRIALKGRHSELMGRDEAYRAFARSQDAESATPRPMP